MSGKQERGARQGDNKRKRTLEQSTDSLGAHRDALSVAEQCIAQSTVQSIPTRQDLDIPDRCSVDALDGEERQVSTNVQVDALSAGATRSAPPQYDFRWNGDRVKRDIPA